MERKVWKYGITYAVRELLDEAGISSGVADRIEAIVEETQSRHPKRSTDELVALKNYWAMKNDPGQEPLEHTKGFEGHVVELRAWRLDYEQRQRDEELERLRDAMQALGKVVAPYVTEAQKAAQRKNHIPPLTQILE